MENNTLPSFDELIHSIQSMLQQHSDVSSELKLFTKEDVNSSIALTTKHSSGKIIKNPRLYPCGYDGCEQRFTRKSSVKRHHRVHTGEKSYECSFQGCGKLFREPGHLTRHIRTRHLSHK
eukprot:c17311_g2_i1.p1 GENE.c17311_g2_i1~~c17311_g2_i1.p1  ORF type:complete len:120 (+),score=22.33 c17311_g2_i1:64-423(+)